VAVVTVLLRGLIGGCAGSTSCSIKVFRYQLLFASVATQVRRLYAPHGIFEPRYEGRPVAEEVCPLSWPSSCCSSWRSA
jgi:trk system potassium uptake protein TrkH